MLMPPLYSPSGRRARIDTGSGRFQLVVMKSPGTSHRFFEGANSRNVGRAPLSSDRRSYFGHKDQVRSRPGCMSRSAADTHGIQFNFVDVSGTSNAPVLVRSGVMSFPFRSKTNTSPLASTPS